MYECCLAHWVDSLFPFGPKGMVHWSSASKLSLYGWLCVKIWAMHKHNMLVIGSHSLISFFYLIFSYFQVISWQNPTISISQGRMPKALSLSGLTSMKGESLPAARTQKTFNGVKLRFLSKGEKGNPPLENLWMHSIGLCARRSHLEGVQDMNQLHSVCPLRLQVLQARRAWNL